MANYEIPQEMEYTQTKNEPNRHEPRKYRCWITRFPYKYIFSVSRSFFNVIVNEGG